MSLELGETLSVQQSTLDSVAEEGNDGPSGGSEVVSPVVICHTVSLAAQALGTANSHPSSHVLSGVMGIEPGTEVLLGGGGGALPLLARSPLLAALLELNNRSGGGSNPDIVFRPDRQSIDRNRPLLSHCLPTDMGHPK